MYFLGMMKTAMKVLSDKNAIVKTCKFFYFYNGDQANFLKNAK